ncbi:MAG: TRAP transporter large permease subunit [Caldilineaceae bacterium]|nr:TRAP transporter large permease subunit [Caldilineaceae bacterium]
MGYEWLAVAMFAGFILILMSGYPVAFSFAGTAIIFGIIGYAFDIIDPNRLRALIFIWFGTMSNFTLLAIPYFIFLGAVLEKSGLAEELLTALGILLGPLRGGLGLAVVIVGTLLAATTGVVAATIIVMGMLTLRTMLRYGYDKRLASGAIVASGTLAQLIPPSLVLILLSDQMGVDVGDLFLGAVVPGLLLAGGFAIYILVVAYFRPDAAPALPPEERNIKGWPLVLLTINSVLPPVLLIIAVLGSIFNGIATPTEAGTVGAVGACILAAIDGKFSWKLVKESAWSTMLTTALVVMILFCASLFSLIFDALGGKTLITELLVNAPGGLIGFLVIANLAVFILGIPLEFTEICFIVMPLFVPAMEALGIDKTWFSIMMAVNLQTAFISPPVGFSLFYLQSVAPKEVSTLDIHRGALPFMFIQIAVLILVIIFPQTVNWLVDLSAEMRINNGVGQGSGNLMSIWLVSLLAGLGLVVVGRILRRMNHSSAVVG